MARTPLLALAVLLGVAAASAAPVVVATNYGAPASAQKQPPATKEPMLVTSLAELHKHHDAPEPKHWSPLPYPNNDDHKWVHQMKSLQKEIEQHEGSLKDLNTQLHEAEEHRRKLKHLQKLLHSTVALHQSEVVLSKLDEHINKIKADIKKLGDQAEEAMRGREDLKQQLQDELKAKADELHKLRARLAQHEQMLTALGNKRADVVQTVAQWRQFVDHLRQANGIPSGGDSFTIPQLPRPPSAQGAEDEDEEAAADAAADGEGTEAGSGEADEGSGSTSAPVEEITATSAEEQLDTSSITAKPHEIQATHDSIEELLGVHLPRVLGKSSKAPPSFLQTGHRMLRRNH